MEMEKTKKNVLRNAQIGINAPEQQQGYVPPSAGVVQPGAM